MDAAAVVDVDGVVWIEQLVAGIAAVAVGSDEIYVHVVSAVAAV